MKTIILKSTEEIEIMRENALLVSRTLGMLAKHLIPGVTTLQLDKLAAEFLGDYGAVSSFLGYHGYPNSICTSVNEQVVHGIPNNRPLKDGDIISIDCGAYKNGYHGDHAYTFEVGEVAPETKKLLKVTKECLYKGIEQFKKGNKIGDIGYTIQSHAESHGYGVVRELIGHGIGREMHEPPEVPNFGLPRKGTKLKNGMVVAIEPMINMGTKDVLHLNDGWTIITRDGKPSAHFEHDVALVNGVPDILSTFDYIEKDLPFEK
ncbi:MAG: type I methionyl aminopeptidase [Ignavibacteriaceae bacterium]|jgi:methionine aminopeptidase, type I (EC 3.4.11.18)|nr:MAG: type I methionyl aminopeptidase [Chlorobiota bacterium]KXK03795.1 MAG: methionine aminopeptidase, type I [Chlorobi bacterium OLB4]MBV6398163.1 Methionine aminopeptidase 1 [Ignavibacteria bacterium]MCC6885926.1 type I methionyl aminopeptidase [Ignavibacteriales bacterium]MCE7953417.1 type I methionyl aminopeptidase [Chlorobi bacterium CHB7]MDL1887353.1 type I methionyl aminopeptidase [Ignavibacteria bacterium CHB1]MEB2330084.1 type I methionyl aminopeptidase [Ignavibacteriaceae bacteri